jgi:phage/plasmid-like protein (TIGR03299 family)
VNNVASILDDDLSIGSAGLLKNGAQAWVSVEVPENITTPEGVEFRPNLLACTSLDGSIATTYKRTVTMVVCDNTLAAGLAEKGQVFKLKHSRYSHLKMQEARDALAIVHTIADDFAEEVKQLCETTVTDKAWNAFLDAHKPLPDTKGRAYNSAEKERDTLRRLWNFDDRVSPWKNTAFGVVQAVNTYVHHEGTVRGASRPERNMAKAVEGEFDKLDQSTVRTLDRVLASLA